MSAPATKAPAAPATKATHEVLTLSEAAAYLRIAEDVLLGLATDQHVPARKIGSEWRFLKAALRDWLRHQRAARDRKQSLSVALEAVLLDALAERMGRRVSAKAAEQEPADPVRQSKEKFRALVGAWKGDPTLDDLVRDIYKARGRPMAEDGE